MALKFSGYTVAHVRSGNYGGSTQFEVFPSEYSYSHCDAKTLQAADRAEFDRLVTAYLNSIKVNGSISLGEYLELLYKQDSTALQAVHARYDVRRPVGNASQPQATLFFVDDAQGTVLRLDPYRTEITWDETTTALGNFMRDHAKHFSSTMQDEFFQKHYGRDH